jgi:hypothetical protein
MGRCSYFLSMTLLGSSPVSGGMGRESAHTYMTAFLTVTFALGVMAGEPAQEQTLSAASTWRLPREPKAVCFALSPDGDSWSVRRLSTNISKSLGH